MGGQASYAKEISGNYMNWNTVPSYLTGSMFCTSDQFGHGTTVYSNGSLT